MSAFELSRRDFLVGAGALMAGLPRSGLLRESRCRKRHETRLILLGTGGGPSKPADRSGPSQLILVDEVPYLVDCGSGAAWQLVRAGVHPRRLSRLFLTRADEDHRADDRQLILMVWASGRATPVHAYGPPPMDAAAKPLFREERGVPPADLFQAHEMRQTGAVLRDERVEVTAAHLDSPAGPCLAYRFDTRDRSIVIAGNAGWSQGLVNLVRGADVLVHEAVFPPGIERILGRDPYDSGWVERALAGHSRIEDAGRLAAAGGVRTLVLSRLVPGDDPSITDDMWRERASRDFRGEILVGKDLMEI